MVEVGDIIGGKYRIEGSLGAGGMGMVFEAIHEDIGKRVAVKVLHPKLAENEGSATRFIREAQAAAVAGHRGIVDIYDVGKTDDGFPYLVMELLEGRTLAAEIDANPTLDVSTTAYVSCCVLSALASAHHAGIVHRDLKPENIFLVDSGATLPEVKLLDFGISRIVDRADDESPRLTRTGVILGTPCYLSPEQAAGDSAVDHRADIHAMGVIVYECLTGLVPYRAENYNALILRIVNRAPVEPTMLQPHIPRQLEEVILRALSKAPEHRYQSAVSMFNDLVAFVEKSAADRIPAPIRSIGDQTIADQPSEPQDLADEVKIPDGSPTDSNPDLEQKTPPDEDHLRQRKPEEAQIDRSGDIDLDSEQKPTGHKTRWSMWAYAIGGVLVAAGIGVAIVFLNEHIFQNDPELQEESNPIEEAALIPNQTEATMVGGDAAVKTDPELSSTSSRDADPDISPADSSPDDSKTILDEKSPSAGTKHARKATWPRTKSVKGKIRRGGIRPNKASSSVDRAGKKATGVGAKRQFDYGIELWRDPPGNRKVSPEGR